MSSPSVNAAVITAVVAATVGCLSAAAVRADDSSELSLDGRWEIAFDLQVQGYCIHVFRLRYDLIEFTD